MFLAGGTLEPDCYRMHHEDDDPESWITSPVRAHFVPRYYGGEADSWQVVRYDSGVMGVFYENPTHWMDIPPLDVQS